MDPKFFVLDGITFQKAAELFFETKETAHERQTGVASYRRCLEDFASALLFGQGIRVGRYLPEVAPGVRPGDGLRNYLGEFAQPIDEIGQPLGEPTRLLNIPGEKANLAKLIVQLESIARSPDFIFWKDLATREAWHIGNDPSILRHEDDPVGYVFRKRFNQDGELRALVPKGYLDAVVAHSINGGEVDSRVQRKALEVFFAENAVTHILNYWWYRKVVQRSGGNTPAIYLPHATRSSLTLPEPARHHEIDIPGELLPILKRASYPVDVLDGLLSAAIARDHRELSGNVLECVGHYLEGRDRKAAQLGQRLTKLANKADQVRHIRLSISPQIRQHRNIEIAEEQLGAPVLSPQSDHLIAPGEYERELHRVFGAKGRATFSLPATLLQPTRPTASPLVKGIWFDHLTRRFSSYYSKPSRKKIRAFVEQFPDDLTDGIIRMLNTLRFYHQEDFVFLYQRFVQTHGQLLSQKTAVCPFDTSGGSSSIIFNISGHFTGNSMHVASFEDALSRIREDGGDRVILVEDALISGIQASRILREYLGLEEHTEQVEALSEANRDLITSGKVEVWLVFLLGVDSELSGLMRRLREMFPKINLNAIRIDEIDQRGLFRDCGFVFGSLQEQAERFFGDVGYAILNTRAERKCHTENEREDYRRRNAIGFGDRQLLVAYWHNVPKATVTLLWEKGIFEGREWTPLFPIKEISLE